MKYVVGLGLEVKKVHNIISFKQKRWLKEYIDLNIEKRKVSLSIKLLEEIQKKEALDKYGAEGSGKNLPFSTLSDKLKKKDKEKK